MARPRSRRPLFSRLGRDSRGASVVEYALLLAAIALTIAGALGRISVSLGEVFATLSSNLLVGR